MSNRERISAIMHLAMLAGLQEHKEPEPDWDYVEKEYNLIQNKKSNLSRKDRELIVKYWEEHLKKEKIMTTYEICPHCEEEVKIPSDKPSNCPNCNEVILPCSTCPMVDKCDWDEKTRCSQYPK